MKLSRIVFSAMIMLMLVGCSSNTPDDATSALTSPPSPISASEPNVTTSLESASSAETVSLNWILSEDEVIAYATAMEPIGNQTSANVAEALFGSPQNEAEQATADEMNQAFNEMFERLNDAFDVGSLVTTLQLNDRGNIAIEMFFDEVAVSEEAEEGFDFFTQMFQGVQLRGEVRPDGSIASFYNTQEQRNLVAVFFELPTMPVAVGDTWEIDFNCISMGSGFLAETADRIHTVGLTAISETEDGRPIAVIDYAIFEVVDGVMENPLAGEQVNTAMRCSYIARGQFLIEEGRWHELNGEMTIASTGLMTTNVTQHFALTPLDEVPEAHLND